METLVEHARKVWIFLTSLSLDYEIVVSFVALIVSSYAVVIFRKQLRVLKWNQIDKTFHFIEMWTDQHMTSLKIKAREYIDYESEKPVEIGKLTVLPNYAEVSTLFITILDFLEMLSISFLKNVVDREITYNYFVYIVIRHYLILEPFVNSMREKYDMSDTPSLRFCGHLEIVAERWIRQMQKESQVIKKSSLGVRYKRMEKKPVYKGKD